VEVSGSREEFDLVVLASGINTKPIPVVGVEYIPPRTASMAVAELHADAHEIHSRLGSMVHVFQIPQSGLIFGALIPKGQFINLILLANGKTSLSIDDFLSHKTVQDLLPLCYERICTCRPLAAVGPARNFYADRFVAVGDAATSRLYKDGIGSAMVTAREAARTAIDYGVSRQDFLRHYHSLCKNIDQDNRWGRRFFSLYDKFRNYKVFLSTHHSQIKDEQKNQKGRRPFTEAALGMFIGNYSYNRLFKTFLRLDSLLKLLKVIFRQSLMLVFGHANSRLGWENLGSRISLYNKT
jgi:flavin-dependent dehydrogenase